jgi:hypothetical protein
VKPKTLLTIAVIAGIIVLMTWRTLSAQKVSCNVCVRYNGQNNCASASDKTELEAVRSAQTTACGPVTAGMNDAIACGRLIPVSQSCHAK